MDLLADPDYTNQLVIAGRNGGFIKPVPFRTYPEYKALHGIEEALHLVQSEYDALDLTHRLVIVWN